MRVWIDQDLCTGDAQCAEICPEVFFLHDDDAGCRCYVKAVDQPGLGPDGEPTLQTCTGVAEVPPSLEGAVVEAAEYCPGACIFIERF